MRAGRGRMSISLSEKNTKGSLRLDPGAAMHALIDVYAYSVWRSHCCKEEPDLKL